jgi:hypothetical protein
VNVTVPFAAAAVAEAEKVICCGVPGVSVTVAGIIVTPPGKPVTRTLICDEKPFSAVAEREIMADPPSAIEKLGTFRLNEKSGVGC